MISIRDVAKIAGVSPATVSRVLNGTAKVDPVKAERIKRIVRDTGYVPNEVARSLYKRSSKLIGLIIPNIENPFFSLLAKYLEDVAFQRGYRLILCNTNEVHHKEIESIRMLSRMNADGIILTTTDSDLHIEATKWKIPVIVMDRELFESKNFSYIMANHYKGGRIATEHMIECGCKNIVNIRGPQNYSSGIERFKGYLDVCKEREIEIKYVDGDYDFHAGIDATKEVLQKYPEVDGIIACNDIVALAAMKILTSNGIKVPEDVQLIGFDNIDWSTMITPELTTVRQPIQEMATKAIELIIQEAEGDIVEKKEHMFDVQLICRNTTRLL